MPTRTKAHRIRLYPDSSQQVLLEQTVGCCRLLHNTALEQRSKHGRPGRKITYATWAAELKSLKAAFPFFADVPHHCLQQALRDLDTAYSRFFKGLAGYPKPWKKYENDSCRFPDPKQFQIIRQAIVLPKLGRIKAVIHRPIQGQLRSVTLSREGSHWYASVLVRVREKPPGVRAISEGGYDVGVAQPVVESDGTVHALPRTTVHEQRRKRKLQKTMSRRQKGSKRRAKTRVALAKLEARIARRRLNAAHQVSHQLTAKYTHLAAEALNVVNMTASARGTVESPGRNVAQKSGLNRSILDIAPGQLRRLCAYKADWRGGVFTCVNPAYTSQTCSECQRHPKDNPATAHLPHGRISRSVFLCPLCGYTADADVNAARNIRARGRQHWAAPPILSADGYMASACGALSSKDGDEAEIKICVPSGGPNAG